VAFFTMRRLQLACLSAAVLLCVFPPMEGRNYWSHWTTHRFVFAPRTVQAHPSPPSAEEFLADAQTDDWGGVRVEGREAVQQKPPTQARPTLEPPAFDETKIVPTPPGFRDELPPIPEGFVLEEDDKPPIESPTSKAFDPDAYLAGKAAPAFEPDAHLIEKAPDSARRAVKYEIAWGVFAWELGGVFAAASVVALALVSLSFTRFVLAAACIVATLLALYAPRSALFTAQEVREEALSSRYRDSRWWLWEEWVAPVSWPRLLMEYAALAASVGFALLLGAILRARREALRNGRGAGVSRDC